MSRSIADLEAKLKILHFADLHIGVENYGRFDSATGLSSRLADFLTAFDRLVAYAIDKKVDLVVFSGDAYKSRDPSQTQQREFARRVSTLASSGIQVFLLVGNHDQPNAAGRATTTEIFDTLDIANVHVSGKAEVRLINTRNGPIQIASLPWLRRSSVLSVSNQKEEKNLSIEELNQRVESYLAGIIENLAGQLDKNIPSILSAHLSVNTAKVGSERNISIGYEPTVMLSNIANPAFDYVALGHIHKQQVLSSAPPVIYPGSLERLDFGEEKDDKGFYLVEIDPLSHKTDFEFIKLEGRRFLTIELNLNADSLDPTLEVINILQARQQDIKDAIVRLKLELPAEIGGQLRDSDIREALREAHNFTISKNVIRLTRQRADGFKVEGLDPIQALEHYLEIKQTSAQEKKTLLEYGRRLYSTLDNKQTKI
ncbi:Exonuclease SbcD [Dehalococcoides mccartyi]|uniref:Nuclease SbcCD subunit D n=2 Tax=Dehalococcoides mccartyi TaxID=61435 RepID=A0A328EQN3_9CHLR|nr:Exonuclease SbcD [Dehalococcoides mccartyi]